jgi:Type VI secretion system/phage-baseplate injector OB domain
MSQEQRTADNKTPNKGIGSGPYLAKVVDHLDGSFMGDLEVTILRDQGNEIGEDTQTYTVRCAQPFFGYTGFEFQGNNSAANTTSNTSGGNQQKATTADAYNDTQKSYGMWFVPPDVGVTVIVIFINGDPSQGYWIGCVPARFSNHMVPAIGGSTEVDMDDTDKKKYNTKQPLPVAEINRRINGEDAKLDPEKIKKPLHPMAEHFLESGLLEDDTRGVTTTTSRRSVPNSVYGILTPGPLDRRPGAKKGVVGKRSDQTPNPVPVSRLGGTQFVMDDGDDRYQRKKPPGGPNAGGVEYADVLKGETGQPDIPYNEYFRVRTRTGHQLLMHNSEDLIYISNSRGTAWIELTSNGKIDIYCQDSISIHSEADFNFHADRDINLEAGRNINLKSIGANIHMEAFANLETISNADTKISVGANYNLLVGAETRISSNSNLQVNTNGSTFISSSSQIHLGSGDEIFQTGSKIHLNDIVAAQPASNADFVTPYDTHDNPSTSTQAGWNPAKYQTGLTKSIMKRIPMHEPWPLHEHFAPNLLTPTNTDRDV